MTTRRIVATIGLGTVLVLGGCATSTNKSADGVAAKGNGATTTAHTGGSHDMGGMDHAAGSHDASGMDHGAGDHAAVIKSLFPNGDDKGFLSLENGHQHNAGPDQFISDPAVRAKLRHQLNLTMDVIRKYPTVKDAVAAGYRRAGPFTPALGAHYTLQDGRGLNADGVMDDADILEPLAIIYDGTDPASPIAGFMYYSMSKDEPEGFAGPNDHWHYHTSICLTKGADGGIDAPYGADRDIPEAKCKAIGGNVFKQTQWMVHVWTVPSYTSALGVFSHNSPALPCKDGSFYSLPEDQWLSHPLDFCKVQ